MNCCLFFFESFLKPCEICLHADATDTFIAAGPQLITPISVPSSSCLMFENISVQSQTNYNHILF